MDILTESRRASDYKEALDRSNSDRRSTSGERKKGYLPPSWSASDG